jgi:phospholipid-translocating ATPase
LENARNGGINIWMLTGDKIETAICIAISSGIKSPTQQVFLIKECDDELKMQNLLAQFESLHSNYLMVIDGVSLTTALRYHEKYFFGVAAQAQSVVCCRCSPTQKARITECIKEYTKKVVACIGDGGNDVGMI